MLRLTAGAMAASCVLMVSMASAQAPSESVGKATAYVEDQLGANGVPGASMAIVDRRGLLALETFGTNGRGDEPVSAQTPFLIASVSKSFTAIAVMQLSELGQVDLDAPVTRYLPWFAVEPADRGADITVRTLLNQTSGLPTSAGGDAFRYLDDKSIEDTGKELVGTELSARPGTGFEYSNGNYVLLGAVLEAVSGQTYAQYMQSHIFDPLGMHHTYLSLDEARENGVSEGHRYWFGWTVPHTSFTEGLTPAGGVISTAPDMGRYMRMHLGEGALGRARILSRQSYAELTRPAADAEVGAWAKDPNVSYAMGLYVGGQAFGEKDAIFHPGGGPDFGSMMTILPESQIGLVVLYNATPEIDLPGAAGAVDRIPAGATSILMGAEPGRGWSMHAYYRVFDALVILLLATGVWLLVRAVRAPRRAVGSSRRRTPGAIGATLVIAIGFLFLTFPLITGVGWRVLILSVPDFSITLIGLGMATVAIGTLHLVRRLRPVRTPLGELP